MGVGTSSNAKAIGDIELEHVRQPHVISKMCEVVTRSLEIGYEELLVPSSEPVSETTRNANVSEPV